MYRLYHGNCLDLMQEMIEQRIVVDAVITDPPYGTTACKWDTIIPFYPMWDCLEKLVKPSGAIVFFGSQPFTSKLISSNITGYRYSWVWNKKIGSNFISANRMPLKITEDIMVFGGNTYYPQKVKGKSRKKGGGKQFVGVYGDNEKDKKTEPYWSDEYHPTNIIEISNANRLKKFHPTEKPVELMEYLIKTYTLENETVLDFTMGSGTTGIACLNTNRNFYGIELEREYFEIAKTRHETCLSEKSTKQPINLSVLMNP